jgi:phosphoglycerol transferase MdoB-like AlkP superfamily enzyme
VSIEEWINMPSTSQKILGIRHTYILLAALFLTLAQLYMGGWLIAHTSIAVVTAYLLLFCLLLRPLFWPLALGIGILITWFLNFVNDSKIALTQLPVTFIDFAILARDPRGFFNAMGFSQIEVIALLGATAAVLLAAVWIVLHSCLNPKLRIPASRSGAVLLQTGSVVLFLGLLSGFSKAYVSSVQTYLENARFAWSPVGVARLSHQLGVYGFLLYSYALDKSETGLYFSGGLNSQPPTPPEIEDAVRPYVHLHPVSPDRLPNIMVVLAESTFDFNRAFKLKQRVENYLFEPNENTRAIGPVYPNAIGGGTWLSEFETVVGMDERLFGYAGYYTHSSLSPFVKKSLVTYLEGKGYSTIALYPTEGAFYNARYAFTKYGFQRFMDAQELGIKDHWKATDAEIADGVISHGGLEHLKAPFFAYVDFLENHAPHRCDKFSDSSQFYTSFSDPAGFEQNCILNEFIRRAKSSEAGFRKLVEFMQETERRTGRPYVIVIFGDHQPHTFTTGKSGWSKYDYAGFRTAASPRETFFHVVSSIPDVMQCCHAGIPHLSLLPTLLSAYTTSKPEDLYLGVNFYVYKNCGSDLLVAKSRGVYAPLPADVEAATKHCSVFDKVLSSYHHDHIF